VFCYKNEKLIVMIGNKSNGETNIEITSIDEEFVLKETISIAG
tara:strand:+ start:297 stop:425 length:129 start_codon:yes stop_codon:yes gene_type:complete